MSLNKINRNTFVAVAMTIFVLIVSYNFYSKLAKRNAENIIALRLLDGMEGMESKQKDMETILNIYEQSALSKCRTMAFWLTRDNAPLHDQKLLTQIAKMLNVDEIHISDSRGFIISTNLPQALNYNMASQTQSAEFLPAIGDQEFQLIQQLQSRGLDQKKFQYVGVGRLDAPGIVQIGYTPERYEEERSVFSKNKLSEGFRIGENGFLLVVMDRKIIAAENKEFVGRSILDIGISEFPESGISFNMAWKKREFMGIYEDFGGYKFIGVLPESEIYAIRNVSMGVLYTLSLIFLAMMLFGYDKRQTPRAH